jgi:peptidoglycan/xylan/chitin deacetylase (PgdA/CDA1 family)
MSMAASTAQPDTVLPVLMYHSVSSVPDGPLRDLAVPAKRLHEQLTALSDAGYALVGLTEALRRKAADPTDPVVGITFDDGYLDFLTAGLDVLGSAGARATLYISVGHMGQDTPRMATESAFGRLLSWDQVREVAGAGVEIGNHAFLHHPLDVLPAGQLDTELRTSKERLEQEVGTVVPSFAYPHGYNSRRVRELVARYGHENACEVGRRLYHPPGNRFAIPRLHITPDHSGPETVTMVRTGGSALIPAVKRAIQPGWRAARWISLNAFGKKLT